MVLSYLVSGLQHPPCHQGLSLYYIYLCISVCAYLLCGYTHVMVCMRRSEDNLWESVDLYKH